MWVTISHLSMLCVVLPVVMKWPRQRVQVSVLEAVSHSALLGLAVAAYLTADEHDAVAFLLLPLLMWAAARFTSRWANLELLASACGIMALTAFGRGPFEPVSRNATVLDIAASSQTFVAISGITAVAFSVAMCRLRDSLRRVREGELQLRELVDSASGTAFIATDLDGTITLFNPGAEQILGYTAEEVVGRTTPVQFHDHAELEARAEELGIAPGHRAVTRPLEDGVEQDTRDWTYIRKDQSRITVSLSATAVRDNAGRPASYLAIVRDVSDRRAAEQALVSALAKERAANQQMHELDRAKSQFVSAVSHELRTPLTSIVGYTELLSEGDVGELEPGQLELIERIDRNSGRLLRLVEDLLTLARVEEGSFECDRVPTDLRDPVRSGVEALACTAAQSNVALNLDLPDDPVPIDGDAATLERLVVNLVGNAVKFTATGGQVTISLRTHEGLGSLSVSDTGMGIPVEEQDRLFQRFFRSSTATENAIQGTGLGLSIVRSIAEAHDGRMSVESAPGVGTTFTFTVPLRRPASSTPGAASSATYATADSYR
jgi:PAS domain S-box-containing protein